MSAGQYVAFLQTRAADLLNEGRTPSYPASQYISPGRNTHVAGRDMTINRSTEQ
jgi:hypothetical protein